MNFNWTQIASIVMFLGVLLGAFGAHALRGKMDDYALSVFKTAGLYQFVHGLALFVVAWLSTQTGNPKTQLAGIFFLLGIILFSGSLYLLSVTGIKWLGAITPLGGISFLIGWIFIFLASNN